jgi:hypothetical protein
MASADSSPILKEEASPGKVHGLSARAVRLYPMRLSVTVGFRVFSHAHRPHRGLTACSCSYGRAFATDFFRAERLAAPALSFTTVVVTHSGHFLSSDKSMPMPGTRVATFLSRQFLKAVFKIEASDHDRLFSPLRRRGNAEFDE